MAILFAIYAVRMSIATGSDKSMQKEVPLSQKILEQRLEIS